MKPNTKFFLLLFGSLIIFASCQKEDIVDVKPIPTPLTGLEYHNGELSCEECYDLGKLIAIENDNLMVADRWNVFWITPTGTGWELQQVLHFDLDVNSLELQGNTLFIGLQEYEGIGQVKIFEKRANRWIETQELRAGKHEDNFGSTLDIDGDHLIIGADAPFLEALYPSPVLNIDTGSIYFYHREADGLWQLAGSFQAVDARPDDRFGQAVAIQGNYAYAGSASVDGLYIYTYDGQKWSLKKRWSDQRFGRVRGLAADGDQLMIRNHYVNVQPINIFQMQEGAPFQEYSLDFNFNSRGNEPTDHGRLVQLSGDYAAVGMEHTLEDFNGEVILLQLADGSWNVKHRYGAADVGSSRFAYAFGLTKHWLVIGDDYSNYSKGKVFLYPIE